MNKSDRKRISELIEHEKVIWCNTYPRCQAVIETFADKLKMELVQ